MRVVESGQSLVVQEIDHPRLMAGDTLEQWLDTLPEIRADDPNNPEWRETPIHDLDLSPFGYDAVVYVKDESDRKSNPTGTFKDRRSHENGPVLYRAFAENLWGQHLNGNLGRIRVPRLTEITAGNVGASQSAMNEEWGLPPPKLLLDASISSEKLEALTELRADIYLADLSKPLTPEQIRRLTNNVGGHDITSSRIVAPQRDFYDWQVHESFNFDPDMVLMPYGSGELFANYLTWQRETAMNGISDKDVRLMVRPDDVTNIDILAGTPRRMINSGADKLIGLKPFEYYGENDIQGMRLLKFTGKNTGVFRVGEEYINLAHSILEQSGFEAEKSAAAGLALYLQRYDRGKIDLKQKILIVNTGNGI